MAAAYMLKNGKIKVPKEVRNRLRLVEGVRVVFYWSSQRDTYAIVAQGVNPRESCGMVAQSESAWSMEEADALLNFHRGRDLSKEETELVVRILQRQVVEGDSSADEPDSGGQMSGNERMRTSPDAEEVLR